MSDLSTTLTQFAIGSCATAIFYPTSYSKVLIQIGHEPFPPVLGKSWFGFGKDCYYLPNIVKYSRHIWRTDGFFGMYKGLLPRLIGSNIGTFVQSQVRENLRVLDTNQEGKEDEVVVLLKNFCKQTSQEMVLRCIGIMASQPFHVIMVRQMAQFVGGERQYDGLFAPIYEIYHTEGIKGFFSGLIPRLIGEVIQIWLTNFIVVLVNKYLIENKEAQSYSASICGLVIAQFTYPFTLVSNIMAVSGAELIAASPPNMLPYKGWRECWSHLKTSNQLKRGANQFFRTAPMPVLEKIAVKVK